MCAFMWYVCMYVCVCTCACVIAKEVEESSSTVLNLKGYYCPVCEELLQLSAIDVLKHKRTHALKREKAPVA